MRSLPVIGLPIAITDYAGAIEWILEKALAGNKAFAVEAGNTHVAALSRSDPEFSELIHKFDLILPDGMPLIWALNSQLPASEKLTDRVYGPNLMLKTLAATNTSKFQFKHFLLGGKNETLTKLETRFTSEFLHTEIAGAYSPPFGKWSETETETIIQKIRESGANLVWVGLGCPKQEHWIASNKHQLPPAVYFGIGAAFAFHAGEVKQAPPILQKFGLEWTYRLAMEPRRLFKRYLTYNSLFLFHLFRDHTRD